MGPWGAQWHFLPYHNASVNDHDTQKIDLSDIFNLQDVQPLNLCWYRIPNTSEVPKELLILFRPPANIRALSGLWSSMCCHVTLCCHVTRRLTHGEIWMSSSSYLGDMGLLAATP